MALVYDYGKEEKTNWIVAEQSYDPAYSGKIESLFALGNGYMGVRAATEERYAHEIRGSYVAGVFDAFPGEVTELANLPDWLTLEIVVEGERFSCVSGRVLSYLRLLDVRSGRLRREVQWESPAGRQIKLVFERFVSMDNLHLGALRVSIEPIGFSGRVEIRSGINGQVTNSGVQHFREGHLRLLPGGIIASITQTQESDIGICVAAAHRYLLDDTPLQVSERVKTDRRRIDIEAEVALSENQVLSIVKYGLVHTDRDIDGADADQADRDSVLLERAERAIDAAVATGYDELFAVHVAQWERIWDRIGIDIDGPGFDQLAVRFAQFQILQMTPRHDPSLSIAAKGLTGEGYKGHVFWDTEIFILPFFTFVMPSQAARLLEYRHRTLDGAREKARSAGYRGAMFAWESALTGEETTPTLGAVDIVSGRHIRIWSGDIEQHISVDVPYAVWHYYLATGDRGFLLSKGLEIMLETARFWASRLEWNESRGLYEITNIIGPDEYGEHVNNNCFTNYMVRWHLRNTVRLVAELSQEATDAVSRILARIAVDQPELDEWLAKAEKIAINIDAESGFIRQYDGFTEKRPVDLSKYHGKVGAITRDYGWEELMTMQVTKQADTVMLLYLRGDDFADSVKHLNWDYYEPKTLHDSSLSPAIHSVVASDMGDSAKAYDYFLRAARIDLGPNPDSSDPGLHAASLGGIWQAVVNGFAGVRIAADGGLRVSPRMAPSWSRLRFPMVYRGRALELEISDSRLLIRAHSEGEGPFEVECNGIKYAHPGAGALEIGLSPTDPKRFEEKA